MKSSRIALIIDDEKQIRRLLRMALEGADHQVFEAETGQAGLEAVVYRRPDVVLLDLGLPDMEGVKVLRRLREWSDVPVLILSVRDDADEKVAALDAGADDYVTKPFDTAELLARVRVIQRRSLTESSEPVFQSGLLFVDFAARQVKLGGLEIKLTPTEYSLLRVLVQNAGKVVTHRQLLRTVWGEKAESQAQYLRVYVTHLRKKLEADANVPGLIKTEVGIGYRLSIERLFVSEGIVRHQFRDRTWSETARRVHVSIATGRLRTIFDFAEFRFDVLRNGIAALARAGNGWTDDVCGQ